MGNYQLCVYIYIYTLFLASFPIYVIMDYWVKFSVWYSRLLSSILYTVLCICQSQPPNLSLPQSFATVIISFFSVPVQFSSVSCVPLFVTPWTAARQASLSIINSLSFLRLMSIESVMPPNSLILCHLLLLPPSIFSSIRVFSSESVLCIRWPKYWSFSFSISLSNEHSGLVSFRMD